MSRRDPKMKNRLPPFVPLLNDTMDSPAWRAMSHGARSLYVALKRRYNVKFHNNGKLFLSQRMAAKETGSHHNEIARWFRELQHYGFIVMVTPGALGVEGKGKAPRWRLTELGLRLGGELEYATKDFLHWDGTTKFKDEKTKSRARNGARGVREMAHTTVPECRPQKSPSVREKAHRYSSPSPGVSDPGVMSNPVGTKEPDSKLWYRPQALRRVATELANSLKDVTDDEPDIRVLILKAIQSVNNAAELLSPTSKPPLPRIRPRG
jgi:hypothetical protein